MGGWGLKGLKDIHIFGKALVARSLWNVFKMWSRLILAKYIAWSSLIDWIRNQNKSMVKVSNQWKSFTLAFPLINNYLDWRVGLCVEICVGQDAIMGFSYGILFLDDIVGNL